MLPSICDREGDGVSALRGSAEQIVQVAGAVEEELEWRGAGSEVQLVALCPSVERSS